MKKEGDEIGMHKYFCSIIHHRTSQITDIVPAAHSKEKTNRKHYFTSFICPTAIASLSLEWSRIARLTDTYLPPCTKCA